jgi:hypothetical protein
MADPFLEASKAPVLASEVSQAVLGWPVTCPDL